jgi:hypothetical protein
MLTAKGLREMEIRELFGKLERINDPRQSWKVKHKMADVVAIVLLSTLGDANDWEEIQMFSVMNEDMSAPVIKC